MREGNAEGSSGNTSKLALCQQEVLVGTLLGDGCLAKHGHHHRLHVKHKAAHRSLVELKYAVFREFISMRPHSFDQQLNGKGFPCVQFATRTHPVFTEWHSRFYWEGRKGVPVEIARWLSPLAVAVWLMDDGAADFAGVTFQTHSFGCEDLVLLQGALAHNFGIATTRRRNKRGEVLYVGAADLPQLQATVGPFLLADFEYKLIPRRDRTP